MLDENEGICRIMECDKLKEVQDFIWLYKDMILKGKKRYEGCHALWGTCYPASYFLYELLKDKDDVFPEYWIARRPVYVNGKKVGNHTFLYKRRHAVKSWILDPTIDQIPEKDRNIKWYTTEAVHQSQMISDAKMPHKMTRKLLELWNQR